MGQQYHQGQRELQDHFDTPPARRPPGRGDQVTRSSDGHRRFIESRDMFFLATADAEGHPQCSYKGGEPGFVRVVDPHTLAFPVYDGNGMFLSTGNVAVNPHVGLLFIDLEGGSRCASTATRPSTSDDPLLAEFPGAILWCACAAEAVFANCRRYVHRLRHSPSVSQFVPSATTDTTRSRLETRPVVRRHVAGHDPANDPANPAAPAIPQF